MPLPTPCTPPVCVLPVGIRLNGRSRKEEGEWGREGTPLPTDPSTTVSFTDSSWNQMAKVMPWPAQRSEVGGAGVTEIFLPGDHNEAQQVCSFKHTHGGGLDLYPALAGALTLLHWSGFSSTLGRGLEVGTSKNLCRFSQLQNLHSQGHAEPPACSLCLARGCRQHILKVCLNVLEQGSHQSFLPCHQCSGET